MADALTALLKVERRTSVALQSAQIMEKFGELRIYIDVDEISAGPFEVVKQTAMSTHLRNSAVPGSVREQVHAIADEAARRAEGCCIRCGPAATLLKGWKHLCDIHGRGATP